MIATIFKKSTLYAIGTAARAATSIIMLPIYTRYLTPDVYGTAELLNIILDLTVLLLGAQITGGVFKFYSDAGSKKEKNTVVSTAIWLGLLVNVVGIILLWLSAPFLASALGSSELTLALRWFSFTLAFATITELGMGYYRVNDMAGSFLMVSLAKLAIQIAANVYFIVFLEMGLWGIIYSALLAGSVQAAWLAYNIIPKVGVYFSISKAKELAVFGLPLVFGSIAMYYITFADRYYLQYFHDATSVGLYALSYKFGFMLLALVWAPFMSYWGAKQFDHAKEDDGAALFGRVFEVANYILWLAATGMLLFASPIIRFIADASYFQSIEYIPYIVMAYVFLGWTEFHRFGIFESKRTYLLNRINWFSVLIVSVAYISLIPNYGGGGAALATLLVMAVRFVVIYHYAQKYYSFYTPWFKVLSLYLLTSVVFYLCSSLYVNNVYDFILSAIAVIVAVIASFICKASPITIPELTAYWKISFKNKMQKM
ncbi:lipopolysaccharide biosynthesis protein [Dasania marina]|uniref:lipopolysaccharide biosynthesis protein n=1 Tax=Dasania marina TaxID=471499 RepID=UPI00035FDFD4|nr:oligosaccharide flippase family protein [Dasania marina]